MFQVLLGGVIVATSAVLAFLAKFLGSLLPAIDSEILRPMDSEAEETRIVQWVFIPLAKQISGGEQPPPRSEIDRVKSTYNAFVAKIEILRLSLKQHEDAKAAIHKYLGWTSVVLIPVAVLIQEQVTSLMSVAFQIAAVVILAALVVSLAAITFEKLRVLRAATRTFIAYHQSLETTLSGVYFQYRPLVGPGGEDAA